MTDHKAGKALVAASVVMVIAVTPTILDAWRAWIETPEHRPVIILTYVVAVIVAIAGADMLVS